MEKSNYIETLAILNKDKVRVMAELELIEMAIKALTSLSEGVNIVDVSTRVTNSNTNGDLNGSIKKVRKNYYEDVVIEIPNSYSENLTPMEQLVYALKVIGSGTIEDIAGCIVETDATRDYEKIFPRFREIASALFRAGKINADTRKKKYKYSLKKEDLDKHELDREFE